MRPTDPLYKKQWQFDMLGTLDGKRAIERIWNDYTGHGVLAAIVDEGVQLAHPDLENNYEFDPEAAPGYDVGRYHGTAVAGLMLAENNGIGGVGVAFNTEFESYKFIQVFGTSGEAETLDNLYKYDIVNNSWGFTGHFSLDQNTESNSSATTTKLSWYRFAEQYGRNGLGTILVQSAGNDNLNANEDGLNASRFTVTVGSLRQDGFASGYSEYGACLLVSTAGGSKQGEKGADLWTTDLLGSDGLNSTTKSSDDYTDRMNGTSAAAPITSGVVSLMLEANAGLGWRDVQDILAYSARLTGSGIGNGKHNENYKWFYNGAENWNGGGAHFSEDYGYGAVDVFGAVRMAEAWTEFREAQTLFNEEEVTGISSDAAGGGALVIPDGGKLSIDFDVADNVTVEHIDVTRMIAHQDFRDLRIFLVSPHGTKVMLYDGKNTIEPIYAGGGTLWKFGADSFRGESSAGTWKFIIQDVDKDGIQGTTLPAVNMMTIYGSQNDRNDIYHYTNEFEKLATADGSRYRINDVDGGFDWIDAVAVDGDIEANLKAGKTATVDGRKFFNIGKSVIEGIATGDGDDHITGNAVGNRLLTYRGNDMLSGKAGSDYLYGGYGHDILTGGDGVDTFAFRDLRDSPNVKSADVIVDFHSGADFIDLSKFDADRKTERVDDFNFIGSDPFSDIAGQLRVEAKKNDILLMADVDGGGSPDFVVLLKNVSTLADTDFLY